MQEIGLEASLVDAIISGQKLVEAKLADKRFLSLQVGDRLSIRKDIWEDGKIVHSVPGAAFVQIIGILPFASFTEMIQELGYERIIPAAKSPQEALNFYRQFYSNEDEMKFGVLAFELKLFAATKS
jgi:ASC-1-like (ASCH) protein